MKELNKKYYVSADEDCPNLCLYNLLEFKNNKLSLRLFECKGVEKPAFVKGVSFFMDNNKITIYQHKYELALVIDKNGLRFGKFDHFFDMKENLIIKNNQIINEYGNYKSIIENGKMSFFINDDKKTEKDINPLNFIPRISLLENFSLVYEDGNEVTIDGSRVMPLLTSPQGNVYMSFEKKDSFNEFMFLIKNKNNTLRIKITDDTATIEFRSFIIRLMGSSLAILKGDAMLKSIYIDDVFYTKMNYDYNKIEICNGFSTTIFSDTKKERIDASDYLDSKIKRRNELPNLTSLNFNDSLLIKDSEERLNNLIGLELVKKQINRFTKIALKSIAEGRLINLNMMFLGNPGTGKTTVARIIADLFYKNGILPTNNLVEGSRETLVGMHVGETSEKTNAAFQSAMGGVLFIDEAYSLYAPDVLNDFGKIAAAELIKLIEENRGKICVIFAGYKNEMHNLLNINPGLKSRFQYEINFEDYSKEELEKILDFNLEKRKYEIEPKAKELLIDYVDSLRKTPNFSNAREIRNSVEQALMYQAVRTFENDSNNNLIIEDDILNYLNDFKENKNENILKSAPMIDLNTLRKYSELKLELKKDRQKIIEAVVEIKATFNNDSYSSGFVISPDGYIVTCSHSVKGANRIVVRRRIKDRLGNIVETYHECKIAGYDEFQDVAIIKMDNLDNSKFPYLPLSFDNELSLPLTPIVVFGYPLGVTTFDNLSCYNGYISSAQKIEGKECYNFDVVAMPGSSGACVIDTEKMKVIAIVNGAAGQNENLIPFGSTIKPVINLVREGKKND